jgi:hypothetical protein
MLTATLGSGVMNMNKTFSCSEEEEKTGKTNDSTVKASWRK